MGGLGSGPDSERQANEGGVDWEALRAPPSPHRSALLPYSHFPVGVAGFVDDGRLVSGANVENASYGLTLCAECSMVSALHASGGGGSSRPTASTVTARR